MYNILYTFLYLHVKICFINPLFVLCKRQYYWNTTLRHPNIPLAKQIRVWAKTKFLPQSSDSGSNTSDVLVPRLACGSHILQSGSALTSDLGLWPFQTSNTFLTAFVQLGSASACSLARDSHPQPSGTNGSQSSLSSVANTLTMITFPAFTI